MADQPNPPADVYADGMQVSAGPYGYAIHFTLTSSGPKAVGQTPAQHRVASVRLSPQLAKVMVFVLRAVVKRQEDGDGMPINVSRQALSGMGVATEDWDAFWSAQ